MKEEGITYGDTQFNRYLEDLVGIDVSKKINEHQSMLMESLGSQRCFCAGSGLIDQDPVKLIKSLFVIPIDTRKGASKLFKYFLKNYDLEGTCIGTESFNIKEYPLPKIGFFKKFDKELVKRMEEYGSNEKILKGVLRGEIVKVPHVILPIETKIIEAHFDRAVSLSSTGYGVGLSKRPDVNINYLKSDAYSKREDAVIVEPALSGLSGRYTFVKFQDEKKD